MLRRLGERGTTLIEALAAVAIATVMAVLISPIVTNMMKGVRQAERKNEALDLSLTLSRWLRQPACSCHLDRDQNTAKAAILGIDTTNPNPPDINLGVIRDSCDLASPDNIVVEAARPLPRSLSRLAINEVKITNIQRVQASGLYSARLSVTYANDGELALRAPLIPMVFSVDNSGGTPASRKIKDCGIPSSSRITSCPANMELIGQPGAIGTFCIERNSRPPPPTMAAASSTCAALPAAPVGQFRVCQIEALTVACRYGTSLVGIGTQWELIDNGWDSNDPNDNHVHAAGAGCASMGHRRGYGPYRCCLM